MENLFLAAVFPGVLGEGFRGVRQGVLGSRVPPGSVWEPCVSHTVQAGFSSGVSALMHEDDLEMGVGPHTAPTGLYATGAQEQPEATTRQACLITHSSSPRTFTSKPPAEVLAGGHC